MVSFKGKEEEEGRRYSISTAVYLAEKCKYKTTGSSLLVDTPIASISKSYISPCSPLLTV